MIPVWAVLVALVSSSTASAQEADNAETEAQATFDAGREAFDRGDFELAIVRFRRSYELSGRGELLFNIGHASQLLGRNEDAIDAFEAYLAAAPNAANRARVERRITMLRDAVARSGVRPASLTSDDDGAGAAPWILFAAGLAVGATGGALLGVAAAEASSVTDVPMRTPWNDVRASYDRTEALSVAGPIAIAAGAALALAGLVWVLLDTSDDDEAVAFSSLSPRVW